MNIINKPRIRLKVDGGYKWFSNIKKKSDIALCMKFIAEMRSQ